MGVLDPVGQLGHDRRRSAWGNRPGLLFLPIGQRRTGHIGLGKVANRTNLSRLEHGDDIGVREDRGRVPLHHEPSPHDGGHQEFRPWNLERDETIESRIAPQKDNSLSPPPKFADDFKTAQPFSIRPRVNLERDRNCRPITLGAFPQREPGADCRRQRAACSSSPSRRADFPGVSCKAVPGSGAPREGDRLPQSSVPPAKPRANRPTRPVKPRRRFPARANRTSSGEIRRIRIVVIFGWPLDHRLSSEIAGRRWPERTALRRASPVRFMARPTPHTKVPG